MDMPVSIEDIRGADRIYYGYQTCWWTHKVRHLDTNTSGLPCDPRGGVLLETVSVDLFLSRALSNPAHYGKHGIKAFLAAHHENTIALYGRPWCWKKWELYNCLLDIVEDGEKQNE